MSSLNYCIDVSGISKAEGDRLKARAKAIRLDEGFSAKDSNMMAVQEAISGVEGEKTDIVAQIKKQLPEYFKAPEKVKPKVEKENVEITPEKKIVEPKKEEKISDVERNRIRFTRDKANDMFLALEAIRDGEPRNALTDKENKDTFDWLNRFKTILENDQKKK